MSNPILNINNLSIGYNKKVVVKDINCSYSKPLLILLVGANGRGKSTLLKTISGFIPQIEGFVKINQIDISLIDSRELSQYRSVMLNDHIFDPFITVKNLLLFSKIPKVEWHRNPARKFESEIIEYCKENNLEDLIDRKAIELSDGQKQRVKLAQCVLQDTPLIFLDEPTAHLDIKNKIHTFEYLHKMKTGGKTIICCTHDIDLALMYSDEIWIIDKNEVFRTLKTDHISSSKDLLPLLF